MPHTRPDAGSRLSDRGVVGQRRHGARTQDHERVFQGRHHGKGEPVELKTECDVIRMDSLTHTLRQLGGGARRGSAAEELSSIRPSPGGSPSDVLSARQIFIGLSTFASDHERELSLSRVRKSRAVASATTKLAHSTSDASLTARAPTVPAVVFCTTVRPPRSIDRSRPGELTVSNPGADGPSLSATQSGWRALSARASSSDSARTIFSAPWAKAQAATVKARMTSTTTATDGASASSAIPRKRVSIPVMIAHARRQPGLRDPPARPGDARSCRRRRPRPRPRQINYRFVGRGGPWSYRLDTFNISYGPASPEVFLGTPPTRRVDERGFLR